MNLYNEELRNIVNNTPAPHSGFILEVFQTNRGLGLRFFIDNYDSFSYKQQRNLSKYVSYIRNEILKRGIRCEVEAI